MSETGKFKLWRDGQKDLEFEGVELASVDNRSHQGEKESRWTELALYRTRGGKYVLHRKDRTCWQGEEDSETAEVFDTVSDLVDEITEEGGVGNLYKELIEEAAKEDDALDDVLVERIE